jgi:sugar O-acyltransferase (sialic acid O-acetyltransferase NeuD family)
VADRRGRQSGVVIAGTGGFARETADALRAGSLVPGQRGQRGLPGPRRPRFAGFLDDAPNADGHGRPVLGVIEAIHQMPSAQLVVCVGNPRDYFARALIVARLGLAEHRYGTVLHPRAEVSPSSSVGRGSVLLAGAVLTADARVGRHVAVMPQAVVTHDVVVDDFATLGSGVRLGGGCRIGRGAYLGAGALVREGVSIGAWSLIGMGSVVLGDIGPGEVWVGNPARRLRAVDVPAFLLEAPKPEGVPA